MPEGSDIAPVVAEVQAALALNLTPNGADGRFLARTTSRGVATLIDEKLAFVMGGPTPIAAAKDLSRPMAPAAVRPPFMSYRRVFRDWKVREEK